MFLLESATQEQRDDALMVILGDIACCYEHLVKDQGSIKGYHKDWTPIIYEGCRKAQTGEISASARRSLAAFLVEVSKARYTKGDGKLLAEMILEVCCNTADGLLR